MLVLNYDPHRDKLLDRAEAILKFLFLFITCVLFFRTTQAWAAVDTGDCAQKVSDFKEDMSRNLAEEKGKFAFRAASLESKSLWDEYLDLKKACTTANCVEILNSRVFVEEMDPVRLDSTNGIAIGFNQDIHALAETLKLAAKIPDDKRLKTDLDKLIKELRWRPQGSFAQGLQQAYLHDLTFSGGDRSLVKLTLGLGDSQIGEGGYIKWLRKGQEKLDGEVFRIINVYIKPYDKNPEIQASWASRYGANLSPLEMETAEKMKKLVTAAARVTDRLRNGVAEVKTDLVSLRSMPSACLTRFDLLDYLSEYNHYANPVDKKTGSGNQTL